MMAKSLDTHSTTHSFKFVVACLQVPVPGKEDELEDEINVVPTNWFENGICRYSNRMNAYNDIITGRKPQQSWRTYTGRLLHNGKEYESYDAADDAALKAMSDSDWASEVDDEPLRDSNGNPKRKIFANKKYSAPATNGSNNLSQKAKRRKNLEQTEFSKIPDLTLPASLVNTPPALVTGLANSQGSSSSSFQLQPNRGPFLEAVDTSNDDDLNENAESSPTGMSKQKQTEPANHDPQTHTLRQSDTPQQTSELGMYLSDPRLERNYAHTSNSPLQSQHELPGHSRNTTSTTTMHNIFASPNQAQILPVSPMSAHRNESSLMPEPLSPSTMRAIAKYPLVRSAALNKTVSLVDGMPTFNDMAGWMNQLSGLIVETLNGVNVVRASMLQLQRMQENQASAISSRRIVATGFLPTIPFNLWERICEYEDADDPDEESNTTARNNSNGDNVKRYFLPYDTKLPNCEGIARLLQQIDLSEKNGDPSRQFSEQEKCAMGFAKEIIQLGGGSLQHRAKVMLTRVMTDSLANTISHQGGNGKHNFSKTKLYVALREAIIYCGAKDNKEAGSYIADFFLRSGTRLKRSVSKTD